MAVGQIASAIAEQLGTDFWDLFGCCVAGLYLSDVIVWVKNLRVGCLFFVSQSGQAVKDGNAKRADQLPRYARISHKLVLTGFDSNGLITFTLEILSHWLAVRDRFDRNEAA